MAFPLLAIGAVGRSAIARLASQLATKNAATSVGVVSRLRSVGQKVGDSVVDIVDYVKKSPLNALMYAGSAASLGVVVADLLPDADPETRKMLDQVSAGELSLRELALLYGAASASESLAAIAVSPVDRENRRVLANLLEWARVHYGTVDRAIEAHLMHQGFMELPNATVVDGYADKLHLTAQG